MSENIKCLDTKNVDVNQLNNLFEAVGWGRRDIEKCKIILKKSSKVISVWDDSINKLIAFGRIMEDSVMCVFFDIAVHPDYQRKGFGNLVMNKLLDFVKGKEYASISLFAWDKNPYSIKFYEKLGFKQVENGMKFN